MGLRTEITLDVPLNILVVGNGFGGLAAAIECRLRGMEVTLVEKYHDSMGFGDIIDFFANGGRIIESWDNGNVAKELLVEGFTKCECLEMKKFDGKTIFKDPWFHKEEHKTRQFAGHRGLMQSIIQKYAISLGVKFKFGDAVVDYKETTEKAGVVLSNGEEIWADCVIAADGGRSLARQKVLGLGDESISTKSGWAVYRSFFQVSDEMRNDPLLKDYTDPEQHVIKIWIGSRLTMLGYAWNEGKNVAWVCMHPDTDDIAESWSLPAKKEDAMEVVKNFSPEARALVEFTPSDRLVDYKLVYRKPLQKWTSEGGRTMLIGDAAHCHLPSAAQGGSQALEDAVTLAICLAKSGKNVPLATQVTERIRFNRSNAVHARGASNRDEWADIPWDFIEANPAVLANRREDWMLEFDAAENAETHYAQIAKDITEGKKGTIEELSLPAGNEGSASAHH